MAQSAQQPHVTITIEPNRWSIRHMDLKIQNTGNAVAYDIRASFDPPLPMDKIKGTNVVPLQEVSILRPGQFISSYLVEYDEIRDRVFDVTISWRRSPQAKQVDTIKYKLSLLDYRSTSWLGTPDPQTQVAQEIKKIREELGRIAQGSRSLDVNIHTEKDRREEAERQRKRYEELTSKGHDKK
ncbi:hypothetical protein [Inquilinus limosus]|uniref:hypothetical protein n=1 Tax=Inquilinus limosus TaxID=171674 RepID=UPI00126A28B7|nr:hypothetical protein [Inquilinus limosus]